MDMETIWRALILFLIMREICFSDESESRAGMYKSSKDFYLTGHTIKTRVVHSEFQCGLLCSRHDSCQSYNYEHAGSDSGHQCELNDRGKESAACDYSVRQGFTYFGRVEVTCFPGRCLHGATCVMLANQEQYQCLCEGGYTGRHCEQERFGWLSTHPGQSCKHIREAGDSKGDGSYWLDPGNESKPFEAYCDMTTDGGGWLLVANFVMDSTTPPSDWSAKTTYHGISEYNSNKTGISRTALGQLKAAVSFTQLRFHCHKDLGTTFHVMTAKNKSGEAVVRFFSGETDALPASCGSYTIMSNDDSSLAQRCWRWGNADRNNYVGKWGHFKKLGERRMYDHAAFEANTYHWNIVEGFWQCDDDTSANSSVEGFWKVYVR